jgi:hypothetical protein
MGVNGQHHTPAVFYPWERTHSTHWVECWVGPGAGVDTEARRKSFAYYMKMSHALHTDLALDFQL